MVAFPCIHYVSAPCSVPGLTVSFHYCSMGYLWLPASQGPGGNWPQVKAVGIEPGHDFQSIVWGFWKEQSSLVAISDMVLPVIVTEESSMPSVLCPQPVLSQEVFSSPNPLAVLASASYWAWQQESWRTAFPLHHHLLPPLPLLVPFRHGSGTAFPFVNLRPSRCP